MRAGFPFFFFCDIFSVYDSYDCLQIQNKGVTSLVTPDVFLVEEV